MAENYSLEKLIIDQIPAAMKMGFESKSACIRKPYSKAMESAPVEWISDPKGYTRMSYGTL